MEAKRWLRAVLFTIIVVGLFANLFIKDSNEAQHTHAGEHEELSDQQHVHISTTFSWLKNIVLNLALGDWQSNNIPSSEQPEKPHIVTFTPNLSTCHKSFAKPGFQVYCCPPKPESEESFIDFKIPDLSSPRRIRRRAHLADKDYIAKYNKALTIMKSLPYEDPRSFRRQADMHCIYCTGAYNQQYSNASFSIHRQWLFFPWHRMMIYFHERILGSLIGDDTFALPFWQWDAPEGMVTPAMYMDGAFTDTEREETHVHIPRIADINYDYNDTEIEPEQRIKKNLAFMYHQMVSGAKKVELFMGCQSKPGKDGVCDGPGTIELAPHNALHTWVGKALNRYRENMGVFYAAARDPIFYAHHSNIDRMWEYWKELRGYEPEIVDPVWLNSHFFFHNENSQLVRVRIGDILNITKLGYGYEKVDYPWLNARPKPSIDPKIARCTLNTRNNGILGAHLNDFRPEGRTLDTNIEVKVHRPKRQRRSEEEEEVLVVYGIDVKIDMFVKFDVYINAIDATSIGPESREFAGTYVNVPRGITIEMNEGDEKMKKKSNLKMGISELLQDLEANEDDSIWVTLVPRSGTGVNTTVDGIRIEYMD
ncbi:hypothetical protein IFM89_038631 [Coptis chinensis]|uniref:Tyrosinase copper-binding domain-containing protein n=1 Tax=Coptis chinensis TaxID=261450 RepID=A0A835I7W5_9MAGN|nr:hypothetical protein IFM89_038631 [Coptis chinensis]